MLSKLWSTVQGWFQAASVPAAIVQLDLTTPQSVVPPAPDCTSCHGHRSMLGLGM